MKIKQRSDALGEKLSPEQTETVFDWLANLTLKDVTDLITAPEPEGLAIPTSLPAVARFARLHAEEIGKRQFDSLDDILSGVNGKYRDDRDFNEGLDEGNFRLIQEKVFRILYETNPAPRELKTLATVAKLAGDRLKGQREDLKHSVLEDFLDRVQALKRAAHGQEPPAQTAA